MSEMTRKHPVTIVMMVMVLVVLVMGAMLLATSKSEATPQDKPWICHPVNGKGETGYGWNLIDPSKASSHIDEATGKGKHTSHDGRTDVYAVNGKCPGAPTETPTDPSTTPTDSTTEPTDEPTDPTSTATQPTDPTSPTDSPTPTDEPSTPTDTPSTGGPVTDPPVTDTPATDIGTAVEEETKCGPKKCVKVTKDPKTGKTIDKQVVRYPADLQEEGL